MQPDLIRLSKFISLILRHKPETIGVEMDDEGWVKVNDLISGMQKHGAEINYDVLKIIVETNTKQRFRFSDDGLKIRANQGHTRQVNLNYQPVPPPEILYHGTAIQNLDSIKEKGLHRGKRFFVHLSEDVKTAREVGKRYGAPVVLIIKSLEMQNAGFPFYHAAHGLWLTTEVPPIYIQTMSSTL